MNISELLSDLTIHYNSIIRNIANDIDLTLSQALHLQSIPRDGISMSKLAKKLGIDNSTLTRNVHQLESKGLIIRKKSPYDRRIQKNFLTTLGIEKLTQIDDELIEINTSISDRIKLDNIENISEVLENVVWALDCIRDE